MHSRIITCVIASLLAFPLVALAGHGDERHRGFADDTPRGDVLKHIGHVLGELDLSEAQKENIHAVLAESRKNLKANHEEAKENLKALHEVLSADTVDEGALDRAADKTGEIARQRVLITGSTLAAVYQELEAEQREALRAIAEERKERFHRHHGRSDDTGRNN